MLLRDLLRRLLQIARSAVIAEPLPELHQRVMLTLTECFDIGQRRKKPGIIRPDRLHSRLLEHDLREPDMIGLPVLPPRQIAGVFREPVKQRRHKLIQLFILQKIRSLLCCGLCGQNRLDPVIEGQAGQIDSHAVKMPGAHLCNLTGDIQHDIAAGQIR